MARPLRQLARRLAGAGRGMRRALLALLLVVPLMGGLLVPVSSAQAQDRGPVVLIGMPGLRWSDLDPQRTPQLWQLAGEAAAGNLSVRTVRSTTCPADGWLTVGAGRRAEAPPVTESLPDGAGCPAPPDPVAAAGGAVLPSFASYVAHNDGLSYDARPGTLAAALAAGGACATAVGPGAALALADAEGRVVSYVPSITDLGAALDRCPAAVVDLGEVDERPIGAPPRDEQVALLGDRLTELLAVLPDDSTLLIAGLADSSDQPHLGLAMTAGLDAADDGWLTANSTRREGLVQLTDVPSTLLAELGIDQPSAMIGSRWQASGDDRGDVAATVDQLVDDDTKAQVVRDVVGPFFTVLVLGQLVLYVLAALGLRQRWGDESGRRLQVLRVTRATSVVFAAVPVSTFLANLLPWWRTPNPLPVLVLDIALWSAALTAVALLGPWRRALLGPFGVVAGATAGVLALDVLTGSTLQLSSLMGYSPLVAGRFYGFGNAAFALFAASSLLATTAAASLLLNRRRRPAAVVLVCAVGVIAAVIDGWPAWGSDFGGVLALVPGFAVLALGIGQVRISPARFALVLAGSVVVVSAVAILDWLRPSVERSHLGRFVQQVLDGEAVTVIMRKLQANYEILTSNILTLLVPFAVVFVVLVLSRPVEWRAAALQLAYRRSPALRPGLVATLVTVIVGFAVNDSGIVIPAVAATVAVPLTLAVCVTALEREELRANPRPPMITEPMLRG